MRAVAKVMLKNSTGMATKKGTERVLAASVCLAEGKIRNTGEPASLLCCRSAKSKLVGWRGLEPRTNALKGHCSTD